MARRVGEKTTGGGPTQSRNTRVYREREKADIICQQRVRNHMINNAY